MYLSLTRLRRTAYHIVVASSVARMRNHGRDGSSASRAIPASISCLRVAT